MGLTEPWGNAATKEGGAEKAAGRPGASACPDIQSRGHHSDARVSLGFPSRPCSVPHSSDWGQGLAVLHGRGSRAHHCQGRQEPAACKVLVAGRVTLPEPRARRAQHNVQSGRRQEDTSTLREGDFT